MVKGQCIVYTIMLDILGHKSCTVFYFLFYDIVPISFILLSFTSEVVQDMVLGTPDAPCSGFMREMQVSIQQSPKLKVLFYYKISSSAGINSVIHV